MRWKRFHQIDLEENVVQWILDISFNMMSAGQLAVLAKLSFPWYLSSKNSSTMENLWKFEVYFLKELEFLEFEFQKECKFFHIFKTMVNY